MSTSTRPRRTTRSTSSGEGISKQPRRSIISEQIKELKSAKRKRENEDQTEESGTKDVLERLLTNPQSQLTKIEMSKVINEDTWYSLSVESRRVLCKLLPRSTFHPSQIEVDWSHPSRTNQSPPQIQANENIAFTADDDESPRQPNDESDLIISDEELATGPPPLFTFDPAFQAASVSFQEHLLTGWFKPSHSKKLTSFRDTVLSGSSHVPWKDESWMNKHDDPELSTITNKLDLFELIRNQQGLIRELDIFSYRVQLLKTADRKVMTFTSDVLLYSIEASKRNASFTFILSPKPPPSDSIRAILPSELVLPLAPSSNNNTIEIPEMDPPLHQTSVSDIADLEDVIIDRICKWNKGFELASSISSAGLKRWTVYRWDSNFERDILPIVHASSASPDGIALDDCIANLGSLGGRSRVGTLYYLAHLSVS